MTDANPPEATRCRNCGTEFSGRNSPLGMCPACLIKLGMSDPNWTPPPETPPETPAVAFSATTPTTRRFPRLPRLPLTVWIAVGALLMVLYAFSRFLMPPGPGYDNPSGPIVRFTIALPGDIELADGAQFAVSPDGRQIVAAGRDPSGRQLLLVRSFASPEWRELRQSDGASHPFWSPDSRQVGFFADRRLKRTDVASGLTTVVCDAPSGRGGAWAASGVIVFAPGSGPLMRVPAAGGTPDQVTAVDGAQGVLAHAWPGVLPDPQRFVYSASGSSGEKNESPVFAISMDTGENRVIVQNGWSAAFARGHLFFVQGTSLIAQPFDARRLEATGDVQRVPGADEVGGSPSEGAAFSVSNDVLVFRTGGPSLSQLVWFDRRGEAAGGAHEPGDFQQFSVSPDGTRVAMARRDERDGSSNIWALELQRGTHSRITLGRSRDSSPVWSPDATRIAFASDRGDSMNIYTTASSGGGSEELLLSVPKPAHPVPTDWGLRGLLYTAISTKTGSDLLVLPVEGERKPIPIASGSFNESDGRFSPDVRYVAYVSDESGRNEVYVQTFPPAEGKWQVSAGGGTRPRWRRDGRELFFLASDGALMSVEMERSGPSALRLGVPQALTLLRGAGDFEISPDGNRVLARTALRRQGDNELQVVLNWATELRAQP